MILETKTRHLALAPHWGEDEAHRQKCGSCCVASNHDRHPNASDRCLRSSHRGRRDRAVEPGGSSGERRDCHGDRCDGFPSLVRQRVVDLYPSVTACANEAKYEIAMEYFAIAGVYGRFDTYRVSDVSSHQIVGILKDHALDEIAKENRDALQSLVGETAGDRERHARLCQRIDSLGPPTYEPTYMRLHGIDAILGTSSAPTVPAPAERAVAWKKALSTYLNCSIASPAS